MLNSNYYNIPNALNYQMMVGHYQAAANPQGKLGGRIFHAILAVLELPPIIGQIAALFELAVVKAFVGADVKIQESHPHKKNVLNENDPVSIQRELKDIRIYEMEGIKNDVITGAAAGVLSGLNVMIVITPLLLVGPLVPSSVEIAGNVLTHAAILAIELKTIQLVLSMPSIFTKVIKRIEIYNDDWGVLGGTLAGASRVVGSVIAMEDRCVENVMPTLLSVRYAALTLLIGGVFGVGAQVMSGIYNRAVEIKKSDPNIDIEDAGYS